jgi:hypothetical protein
MFARAKFGGKVWIKIYPEGGEPLFAEFGSPDELDNFLERLGAALSKVRDTQPEGEDADKALLEASQAPPGGHVEKR